MKKGMAAGSVAGNGVCVSHRPVHKIVWPVTLEKSSCSVLIPTNLETVIAGVNAAFNVWGKSSVDRWTDSRGPASLKHLTFGRKFNEPIQGIVWSATL